MSTTRQLGRVEVERWLYRIEGGDYGPVPTDKLLEAIGDRKVDLGTQVKLLGQEKWSVAGEHALFRNYYEKCRARWTQEDADKVRVAREQAFVRKDRNAKLRLRAILIGGLAVMLIVGWYLWRASSIEGLGLAHAARVRTTPSLPVNVDNGNTVSTMPDYSEKKFPILSEPESPINYDVAGVHVGEGGAEQTVTRLSFGEDGEVADVQSLDPSVLSRIANDAKQGIYACAREHAASNPSFSGTDVGFAVTSGRIARISVGTEVRRSPAFQSCIKAALGRVSVPSFGGPERGVTIPVRIAH